MAAQLLAVEDGVDDAAPTARAHVTGGPIGMPVCMGDSGLHPVSLGMHVSRLTVALWPEAPTVPLAGGVVLTVRPSATSPSQSSKRSVESSELSYKLCYVGSMADTITFRPDEDAARALAVLTRDGTPVSSAVRAALIDAAREQARSTLRAEAGALAADEQDRAEAAQVLRDMESLRAW